jgi:hypothetical protein
LHAASQVFSAKDPKVAAETGGSDKIAERSIDARNRHAQSFARHIRRLLARCVRQQGSALYAGFEAASEARREAGGATQPGRRRNEVGADNDSAAQSMSPSALDGTGTLLDQMEGASCARRSALGVLQGRHP